MMAAAEARAAWQRTANRCIVQEDAKRAPKLACCPSSSSSSSKPQVDASPGDAGNESDHPISGFVPLNWNTASSNLPPDTKWWLQLQPNFGHQKDFTYEQLNALEAELECLRVDEVKGGMKNIGDPPARGEDITCMDIIENAGYSVDPRCRVSATCIKNDTEAKTQELKTVNSKSIQPPLKHKDIGECWYKDAGLMDLDRVDQLSSKESDRLCFLDMDSHWTGSGKSEPWWRTVDKDELASLVAQKSLENIENCDLPPPQVTKVRRSPFTCLESFDHDAIFSPSLDPKGNPGFCNLTDYTRGCAKGFAEIEHSLYGSDNAYSYSATNSQASTNKGSTENRVTSESEPSKAQLLEALRHSQTRAREAEKAAKQAYDEKEHIFKLFFKQASHLFAYKQWLQLLQLETICFQLKNKDQTASTLFPMVLPWVPYKQKKGKRKGKKRRGLPWYDFGKYAIAFALGVGLAGAGLFLGWTMGWLLPMV